MACQWASYLEATHFWAFKNWGSTTIAKLHVIITLTSVPRFQELHQVV